jgi:hypothetical protein
MTAAETTSMGFDGSVRILTAPDRGGRRAPAYRSMRRLADLLFLSDTLVVVAS